MNVCNIICYIFIFLILFIIFFFMSEYISKYKLLIHKIINKVEHRIWTILRRKSYRHVFYAIIFSFMIIITILCYKNDILFLCGSNSTVRSVYSFVWAVIMVFSMDIAISQLVYNDKNFVKNNTYLGVDTLKFLDGFYVNIHHFLRSIFFYVALIYFLIAPVLIFGRKNILASSLLAYLWQTDYVIILLVLTVMLISDFSLPHYVSEIINNKDSSKIKFYVIHNSCKKLQHDVNDKTGHSSFIKFIKHLIRNSYSSKRSNYVPTLETFKLLYYMSTVLFNSKRYSNRNMNKYIHELVNPFMGIVLKYFKHLKIYHISYHRHRYTVEQIQNYKLKIIKMYVSFIDGLLCSHLITVKNVDSVNILPYKLINKDFIHCGKTWNQFNKLFYKSKFVKNTFNNNLEDLNKISYNKYSSNTNSTEFYVIWNNVKKLFDKEMDYIHYEYRHGKSDVAKSLKNEFPIFFDEYINDPKFKYRSSKHEYFYKFLEKINNYA